MPDEQQNNPEMNSNQVPPAQESARQADAELPHLQHSRAEMSDRLGDLKVERVEASDELERIRNQSAHQVQSQTDVVEGVEEAPNAFGDDGAGLMELLKEANLSPRHLRFCCGGILVVLMLLALGYGGIRLVDWWGDRPVVETPVEEPGGVAPDPETPVNDDPYVELDDELKYTDGTVYASLLLGQHEAEEDPAVSAGEILGEELVSDDSLAESIEMFSELFEALQVDVQVLLDQSRDRRDTLTDYTNELKFLLNRGEQELEDLRTISDNLANQFIEVEEEKDLYEQRFFDKLSNLDSYGATNDLNEFIIRGEEVVNLRAQYLARLKLIEYYELVMTSLARRITDIELNEEALVKGVQVVEIEGSDIDLIIREDEL